FALRRAALGVVRILIEAGLAVDLHAALGQALAQQPQTTAAAVTDELFDCHLERLRGYYADKDYTPQQFEAVAATGVHDMHDFDRRMRAIADFSRRPAAGIISAAHKRARNILKKAAASSELVVDPTLFADPHEQNLAAALTQQKQAFDQALSAQAYPDALASLADLAQPLDAFFEHVMVMADEHETRNNRLALLTALDQ